MIKNTSILKTRIRLQLNICIFATCSWESTNLFRLFTTFLLKIPKCHVLSFNFNVLHCVCNRGSHHHPSSEVASGQRRVGRSETLATIVTDHHEKMASTFISDHQWAKLTHAQAVRRTLTYHLFFVFFSLRAISNKYKKALSGGVLVLPPITFRVRLCHIIQ